MLFVWFRLGLYVFYMLHMQNKTTFKLSLGPNPTDKKCEDLKKALLTGKFDLYLRKKHRVLHLEHSFVWY